MAVAGQIADAWQQAHCSRGDFASYARLRDEVRELEREQARLRKQDQRAAVLDGLSRLEPGDVIHLDAGKRSGWLVVIEPARPGKPEPHPLVMGEDHQIVRIAPEQFKSAPVTAAKVRVPKRFDRHSAAARKALSRALDARIEGCPSRPAAPGRPLMPSSATRSPNCAPGCGRIPAMAAPTARTMPAPRSGRCAWNARTTSPSAVQQIDAIPLRPSSTGSVPCWTPWAISTQVTPTR